MQRGESQSSMDGPQDEAAATPPGKEKLEEQLPLPQRNKPVKVQSCMAAIGNNGEAINDDDEEIADTAKPNGECDPHCTVKTEESKTRSVNGDENEETPSEHDDDDLSESGFTEGGTPVNVQQQQQREPQPPEDVDGFNFEGVNLDEWHSLTKPSQADVRLSGTDYHEDRLRPHIFFASQRYSRFFPSQGENYFTGRDIAEDTSVLIPLRDTKYITRVRNDNKIYRIMNADFIIGSRVPFTNTTGTPDPLPEVSPSADAMRQIAEASKGIMKMTEDLSKQQLEIDNAKRDLQKQVDIQLEEQRNRIEGNYTQLLNQRQDERYLEEKKLKGQIEQLEKNVRARSDEILKLRSQIPSWQHESFDDAGQDVYPQQQQLQYQQAPQQGMISIAEANAQANAQANMAAMQERQRMMQSPYLGCLPNMFQPMQSSPFQQPMVVTVPPGFQPAIMPTQQYYAPQSSVDTTASTTPVPTTQSVPTAVVQTQTTHVAAQQLQQQTTTTTQSVPIQATAPQADTATTTPQQPVRQQQKSSTPQNLPRVKFDERFTTEGQRQIWRERRDRAERGDYSKPKGQQPSSPITPKGKIPETLFKELKESVIFPLMKDKFETKMKSTGEMPTDDDLNKMVRIGMDYLKEKYYPAHHADHSADDWERIAYDIPEAVKAIAQQYIHRMNSRRAEAQIKRMQADAESRRRQGVTQSREPSQRQGVASNRDESPQRFGVAYDRDYQPERQQRFQPASSRDNIPYGRSSYHYEDRQPGYGPPFHRTGGSGRRWENPRDTLNPEYLRQQQENDEALRQDQDHLAYMRMINEAAAQQSGPNRDYYDSIPQQLRQQREAQQQTQQQQGNIPTSQAASNTQQTQSATSAQQQLPQSLPNWPRD